MKTRTALLATLIVALLGTASLAQAAGAQARPAKNAGALKALGLSKDQIQQIHQIVKQYRADVAVALKQPGTREEKKSRVEPLKAKATDAIASVLTADQLAKAKEAGLIDRLLSRATRRQAGLMLALKKLGLTDDQKAQVKAIVEDSRAKAKAIKDDTSLTSEQRRAALAELKESTRERIKAVLTTEQQQKLDQLMQGCKGPKPERAR